MSHFESLPTRCKNALSLQYRVSNEVEFAKWAAEATNNSIRGLRGIGEMSQCAIAAAVKASSGRIIGHLTLPNLGKQLGKSYPRDSGFVYVMHSPRMGAYKIGFSADVEYRLSQIRMWVPDIRVVFSTKGTGLDEANTHKLLKSKCIGGEWFDASLEQIVAAVKTVVGTP